MWSATEFVGTTARGGAMDAVLDQMVFSEEGTCRQFVSNKFARSGAVVRKCTECGSDIQHHCRAAVRPVDVMRVIESDEKVPSLICGSPQNGLYQGGWISAVNREFLADANVGLVVNTAAGLRELFPKFQPNEIYRDLGIDRVHLEWTDTGSQTLTAEEVGDAVERVSATLARGKSVLVHCAQGRSRSGSVVVAYVSVVDGLSIDEALVRVQAKRSMAQPNPHFMNQLRAMYRRE